MINHYFFIFTAPSVASTATKKKDKDGPRFPPESPPTLLLTQRDYTEAENIRTEHQDRLEDVSDFSASDAYSQVLGKAQELRTTMINEMGADACRKADTYTIREGNVWGIAFNS